MLLNETGLKIDAFDPVLAAVLGSEKGEAGGKVLAEAMARARSQVQLRDWLYCLVKGPGTQLRKELIDGPGKQAERFVTLIEEGIDPDGEATGTAVSELTSGTVAPAVTEMLEEAERLMEGLGGGKVSDAALTLALYKHADEQLK